VLGLVREAVYAAVFGAGAQLDAFLVAQGVPNVAVSLIATAVVTSSIPTLAAGLRRGERERVDRTFSTLFTAALAVASVGLALVAEPFVRLTAPGFDAEQVALTVKLARILLLASVLVAAMNLITGLLQAHREFFWPAIVGLPFSDDVTATRVRDIVGPAAIRRLARAADMRRFRYHATWGLSRINAFDQVRFFHDYEDHLPRRHADYARRLLSTIVPSQRWGVGRERPDGWTLFFKGGWAAATGRVNHQVAWLERGDQRISLAILTEFSPSHEYAKRTLRGVAERLLRGLADAPR
jgi:hypothetical protein